MAKKRGIVNVTTGKIIGVEPETIEYYHEEGHVKFQNDDQGIRNLYQRDLLSEWIPVSLILGILWTPLVLIAGAIIFMRIVLSMKEEKWCWAYAKAKMLGKEE